jgi:hypothetical protein
MTQSTVVVAETMSNLTMVAEILKAAETMSNLTMVAEDKE